MRGLSIAYSPTLGYAKVDAAIAALVEAVAGVLADLGARVERVDHVCDDPRAAFDVYYYGRIGYRVARMSEAERALLEPRLAEMAAWGQTITLHQMLDAEMVRYDLGIRMKRFHERFDLLLTPQLPIAAFAAGAEFPEGRGMRGWLDWSPFTYPFNFTQQPAATVPCGLTPEGRPAAFQLVAAPFRDDLCLRAARAYEALRPFALPAL